MYPKPNRPETSAARIAATRLSMRTNQAGGLSFDRQTADRIIGDFGVMTPWAEHPVWNETFPVVVLARGMVNPFAICRSPLEGDGEMESGTVLDSSLGTGGVLNDCQQN